MDENEEVCEECEKESDELDDDGYCPPCAFERDIRRAEYMRDMAGDR